MPSGGKGLVMKRDPDCIFCKIIEGLIPCDKVYEDDEILAFRDINPQAPTHILLIPKEHRAGLSAYGPGDEWVLGNLQVVANRVAAGQGLTDFRTVYNCGKQAGQEVFHLHMHLLGGRPFRWPPG